VKGRIIILLSLILLGTSCSGQEVNPETVDERIHEIVAPSLYFGTHTGIAVGVYNKGITDGFYYGYSDLENGITPDSSTIFETGSITKTYTATLMRQLENEGLLDIDDPVENYLPETTSVPKYQGAEVTFRHLLTHTAAFSREARNEQTSDRPYDYHDWKNTEFNSYLNYYNSLAWEPGTYYSYSNAAYGLMGYVAELLTGMSYSELVKERITDPLGMENSGTALIVSKDFLDRRSLAYDTNQDILPFSSFGEHQSSGGMLSNLEDMFIYLEANLNDSSLLYPVFNYCHQMSFENPRYNYDADIPHYGLGWRIHIRDQDTLVGHTGITNHTSYMRFIKEKQLGVIILTNTRNPQRTFEIGDEILDLFR